MGGSCLPAIRMATVTSGCGCHGGFSVPLPPSPPPGAALGPVRCVMGNGGVCKGWGHGGGDGHGGLSWGTKV